MTHRSLRAELRSIGTPAQHSRGWGVTSPGAAARTEGVEQVSAREFLEARRHLSETLSLPLSAEHPRATGSPRELDSVGSGSGSDSGPTAEDVTELLSSLPSLALRAFSPSDQPSPRPSVAPPPPPSPIRRPPTTPTDIIVESPSPKHAELHPHILAAAARRRQR